MGRGFELDGDLRRLLRHPLAGPDVERHSGPTPVVHEELERHISLSVRVGVYVILVAVAVDFLAPHPARLVLAPHGVVGHVVLGDLPDRFQDLHLLLAHRVGVEGYGRFHGR